jgi:arylsulfatase A-like enzyme
VYDRAVTSSHSAGRIGIALAAAALLTACTSSPPTDTGAAPSGAGSPTATSVVETSNPSASASAASRPTPPGTAPNILLIIADDFGLDSSPCYAVGTDKPAMPNLQALCDGGLVFDNVWVNPSCSPTRSTILTGRYGFRTGVLAAGDILRDTDSIQDLLTNDLPYAYPNAVLGKWHLAGDANPDPNHPALFGIQHFAGFLKAAVPDYSNWELTEDGVQSQNLQYITSFLTDKAIDWVGRQRSPWFLWLAYNAPHAPYHLPPAGLYSRTGLSGTAADIAQHPQGYYYAAAEALDAEIGRLLGTMPQDVRANTVVIFVGDNGTPPEVVQAPVTMARAKFTVYEGGVHVPLVVAGRGVTRTGQREDALINGVDLFATIAQLAGGADTSLHDGVSFMDALTNASFTGRDYVYTEYKDADRGASWAVRDRRYKLLEFEGGRKELYDLSTDPWERANLIAKPAPITLESIVADLEAYRAQLLKQP